MTELMQIQPFIQSYVHAISSVLNAEVTVVDSGLIRVGGTGAYAKSIGEKVSHGSFFRKVLATGEPGVIEDVRAEFTCHNCEKHESCKELANIAYPIFLDKNAVGIIALIAFTEAERDKLLANLKNFEEFLKYMSALMESKLLTDETNRRLERQIGEVIHTDGLDRAQNAFIGESPQIRQLLQLTQKVAKSSTTLLIRGESGTGKEILAKMIHACSDRAGRLMISINCAAIPESLVESELFGYESGAFTGAKRSGHTGKFELANHSTLFLDEIGDMPLHVQSKLLRVLQEQSVERVGGSRATPLDVRIVCATHKNLEEMVRQKLFREDLYFRLNIIPLIIPPLRERKEDIPLLIRHFIGFYNVKLGKQIGAMEPDAVRALTDYSWPGNVRELKNVIEYLANIVEGKTIRLSDLPEHFVLQSPGALAGRSLSEMLSDYEGRLLKTLLPAGSSKAEKMAVAAELGLSRATLYRKLGKYGLL